MNCMFDTRRIRPVALALMMAAGAPAFGQLAQTFGLDGVAENAPKAARAPLSKEHGVVLPLQLPIAALPALDNAALIARDQTIDYGYLHVSDGRSLDIDLSKGQWFATADGGRLWAMDVLSPTAYGLRLHLKDFKLPEGASLVTYVPNEPSRLAGPYSGTGPMNNSDFWAETTFSDLCRIELYLPPGSALNDATLKIDAVQHMYRDPDAGRYVNAPEFACHQDFTCWSGWATIGKCISRMYFVVGTGGGACTGELINTYSSDFTPYYVTANHCISTEASANSLETYWFFQTSTCNGVPPLIETCPRASYAHLLRNNTIGDYCLMLLEGAVPRTAYWTGWSTYIPAEGEGLTNISHPAGTYKRIAFGNMQGSVNPCNGISTTTATHIQSAWWLGTAEPGSSGSAVFRPATGQMLGMMSCGNSACPNNASTNYHSFGKFSFLSDAAGSLLNGGSDDGYEPNDSCAAARYLGGVGYVYWGSALVVKINNEDWYRISVPYGGTLTAQVSFTSSQGDIDMGLYDGCGGSLVGSSTSTGNGESIVYTNNTGAARDYYIRVYLYDDTRNQYAFSTNVTAPSPPASDSCGNALTMTEGQTITGATNFATTDGNASCGASSATRDVWYAYRAPCTGILTVDSSGSGYDTVLSAHSGCPGTTANQITCNDDAFFGVNWSQISLSVNKGSLYYIRVSGYNGLFGNYQLHSVLGPPSNDTCANSIALPAGSYAFNSCGCTTDGPPEPQCDFYNAPQIDNDFWCTYIATDYGTMTVSTCGADFDSKVAIYDATQGCPTAENSALACNDDSCGLQSSVSVSVTPGTQYYVRVGGYRGARGSGTLSISQTITPPPPTDPTGTGSQSPLISAPDSVVHLEVAVTPGDNPATTNHTVTVDMSSLLGGSGAQTFYDDGTNGDLIAGDNVYSVDFAIDASQVEGVYPCSFVINDDEARPGSGTLNVTIVGSAQWDEAVNGMGDAGNSLATAQVPFGPFGSSLASIQGHFAAGEDVDVYRIQICDATTFSATTVHPVTGTADTSVFLFDDFGNGMQMDDDSPAGGSASQMGNEFVPANGGAYIAVTHHSVWPLNAAGAQIWESSPFDVVRAPDGVDNGGDIALSTWSGTYDTDFDYRLVLTGVCFPCTADFNRDSTVDFFDYLDFVDAFSTGAANADFNLDGSIDFFDYLDFVNAFSMGC